MPRVAGRFRWKFDGWREDMLVRPVLFGVLVNVLGIGGECRYEEGGGEEEEEWGVEVARALDELGWT